MQRPVYTGRPLQTSVPPEGTKMNPEWVPTLGLIVVAGITSTGGVLAFFTARRSGDIQRRHDTDTLDQKRRETLELRNEKLMQDRVLLINYALQLRTDIHNNVGGEPRPWPPNVLD